MMNITTDIKPISYLQSHAEELLNQLGEHRRPIVIMQNGEPRAVIQDFESYAQMQKELNSLLSINSQYDI